ncbi:MAG: xanthine dehydrogenase family protein subunit M [Chloroflexi bacterium]|nr:xanthine dehydrogenase family protein subunit M [Chloroflexota bacterium]
MRAFDYRAPTTLTEVLALLAQAKGEVRPLVGGTDLIPQLREGRKRPALVLDLKRIPDLGRLEYDPDMGLRIGAAVTCSAVAAHPQVRRHYAALAQAAALVGSRAIQNRASIGGNICNASPSADTVPPLLCLSARAFVAGGRGQREVELERFFQGPGKTILAKDELLVEVVVPPPAKRSASCYLRFTPRAEMDIAVAGVAALIVLDGGRQCQEARLALAAVAPRPLRVPTAEAALKGRALDAQALEEAGELAAQAAQPITDIRGGAEYRRRLVRVLTRQALEQCLAALQAGQR